MQGVSPGSEAELASVNCGLRLWQRLLTRFCGGIELNKPGMEAVQYFSHKIGL